MTAPKLLAALREAVSSLRSFRPGGRYAGSSLDLVDREEVIATLEAAWPAVAAELAAQQPPPAECTGMAASWCPVHGDCTCRPDGDRFDFDRDSPTCPLHGDQSSHAAEEVALACEPEPPPAGEPAGWEEVREAAHGAALTAVGIKPAHVHAVPSIILAAIKPLWPTPPRPLASAELEAVVREAMPHEGHCNRGNHPGATIPCNCFARDECVAAVLAALHSHDLAGWRRAGDVERALREVLSSLEAILHEDEDAGLRYAAVVDRVIGMAQLAHEAVHAPAPPSPWKALEELRGDLEGRAKWNRAKGLDGYAEIREDAARRLRRALGLPEKEVERG